MGLIRGALYGAMVIGTSLSLYNQYHAWRDEAPQETLAQQTITAMREKYCEGDLTLSLEDCIANGINQYLRGQRP